MTTWIIDRYFDMGACLNCGERLDGVTTTSQPLPDPGDISVCAYCSHLMEWDGAKLIPPSEEALKEIAADKDVLAAVELAGRFQRSLKEKP
jgi:hypothetical protein